MKEHKLYRWLSIAIIMLLVSALMISGTPGFGVAAGTGGLKPLNSVPVPLPPNLSNFVRDIPAAIQLGKALFWDMRVGGDGIQACATCHFQAGADIRSVNAINPGKNSIFETAQPGDTLVAAMFPITNGDVVGSSGTTDGNFLGLSFLPSGVDLNTQIITGAFGTNRQVTGRNAPSAINAIYNYRSFWDGRANNSFNGVDPSGPAGNNDSIHVYQVKSGVPVWVNVLLRNASAASQAVGPANSPVEMCNAGRNFWELGRKMLALMPLGKQYVDPTDSVLGPLSRGAGKKGLNKSYKQMIRDAFRPAWWNTTATVANGFSVMEANFSLYWGISVMLYESTLVSDQTPLDNFLAGTGTLTPSQQLGMDVYTGKGRCNKCHSGAELSMATVSQAGGDPLKGFFNTAVRPFSEDGGDVLQPGKGFFKTPGLRNVELNGPFFHDGSAATLRQVVELYDRGGDFPSQFTDSDIRRLVLTEQEKTGLVDFMLAMTDERVRNEMAPFDHPSLYLPNGISLPAAGAAGNAAPVQPFLNLDQHSQ